MKLLSMMKKKLPITSTNILQQWQRRWLENTKIKTEKKIVYFQKAKAEDNIYVNNFARVSKFHVSKGDRQLSRLIEKRLENPSVDNERCSPIKMGGHLSAIQKMKRKRSFPTAFPKSFGLLAFQELLSIFHLSVWCSGCFVDALWLNLYLCYSLAEDTS